MGKKKSTVLMVLLTIVIVVLCAITALPSFAIPGTAKIWNPAVTQYDLGADLGGGYYAYYYPTGVISETEFKELEEEDQQSYQKHGGLYVNTDPVYGIIDDSEPDENGNGFVDEFEAQFEAATKEIAARYAEKGYSDYRVAVVDDFAIRVQLPAYSDQGSNNQAVKEEAFQNAANTFGEFSKMGGMTILLKGSEVAQLHDNELTEIIKEFSVHTQYDTAFIKATFTEVGKEMLDEFAYELDAAEIASSASDSSSVEDPVLEFMIGDEAVITLNKQTTEQGYVTPNYELRIPVASIEDIALVETRVILLNSALNNAEGFDIEFEVVATNLVRSYGSVFGDLTMVLLYVALFAAIVGMIVFAVLQMGTFGVVGAYSTLSYLIVTGICFAFIVGGVYEITLGTVLVFVIGLALMNALNVSTYKAIKEEIGLGKTVDSAVKNGFNKTLLPTVDVYAVLLLGAVALLIGAAGLQTLATQAIICIVTGAFCNLLWTRVINYVFLSASKNKYKYFRVVREDDDDE